MNINKAMMRTPVLLVLLATAVFAEHVKVDYDQQANFNNYKTYSWGKVQTANSIWDARVKDAINAELGAKGWTEIPSDGNATLVAVETTHTKPQLNTLYDGMGGWRWGGFGETTTTVQSYKIGTLVVDMFDTASKNLIWRASSSDALSGKSREERQERG